MGSIQDDLFNDYMEHLAGFGPGDSAYAAPEVTTVGLSTKQGGVLGSCKSSTVNLNLNTGHCDSPTNCNAIGS
jgi:hypothetical protein